jgi:hypothetical protein
VLAALSRLSGHNSGHNSKSAELQEGLESPQPNEAEEEPGAPGEIRTPDLLLRRQSLYPAELRARGFHCNKLAFSLLYGPALLVTGQAAFFILLVEVLFEL